MKLTTNYSLKKPEGSDVVNIDDFNYNADTIDTNLSNLTNKVNVGQNIKLTKDNGSLLDLSGEDLNYITTGFGQGANMKNAPSVNGRYTIESYMDGSNWGHQVATDWFSEQAQYIRHCIQGVWTSWERTNSKTLDLISALQTRVNNSQLVKLTEDSGVAFNISNSDLNSCSTIVGRFLIGENLEHGPEHAVGSWWTIENYSDGTWGHQIGTSWFTGARYMRRCDNGTWQSWREL